MQYKWVWGDGILELASGFARGVHHYILLEKIEEELGHVPESYNGGTFSEDPFSGGKFDVCRITWQGQGNPPSADQIKFMIQQKLNRYGDREAMIIERVVEQRLAADVEDTEPEYNFSFLKNPHKELYPPAFNGTKRITPRAIKLIKGHVLDALKEGGYPDADSWIYFTVYGSGISYNWDESGDFDVQMWVDVNKYNNLHADAPQTADDLVADVRRIVQTVNFPSFKEIGLDAPGKENATGSMLIQYYPKPGEGTKEENLASQPYSCYDLETGKWLQRPQPLTPEFYGEHFLSVMQKAEDIAVQSEALLEELQRNTISWQFWSQMIKERDDPRYREAMETARTNAEQEKEGVRTLFDGVFGGRAKAYSPEGKGIHDERDIVQKLLEVWGVFQRLKHFARQPLPWDEQEMPEPKESKQTELRPHPHLTQVAQSYMDEAGLPYNPPQKYLQVNPDTAAQIAYDYENAEHNPQDPEVAASYDAMTRATAAQYEHLLKHGYSMEFYPDTHDPYPNSPHEAVRDIHNNKHLYVFPTDSGFGSDDRLDPTQHPLLENTGYQWNGRPVTYNDLFRGVHDVFGHAKNGVGFRADGEENAWNQHSAMYSEQARPALTAETRGQNSWVNFGPYGEHNRGAGQGDTWYADQKATILPQWTSKLKKFADWSEIMQNAQWLRQNNMVNITNNGSQHVEGTVNSQESPGVVYNTSFDRVDPNSGSITTWNCSCPWGTVSWGRTRQWKKYEGRPCKHTLAMYWQSLSQPLDEDRPEAQGQQQLFNPADLAPPPAPGGANTPAAPGVTGPPQAQPPTAQPPVAQPPQAPQGSQPVPMGQGGTGSIPGALSKLRPRTALYDDLVQKVRDNLTDDLLKPEFVGQKFPTGHCYVASEALYHLLGGKESGWYPMRYRMPDGVVHWWLANSDGDVLDPTHDQFNEHPPYQLGKSGGFLTREPSKRAATLMKRVLSKTSAFMNGQVVVIKTPAWGIDRDGNQQMVPVGALGEVLWSDDNESIVIFPLDSGILEPHLVRVQTPTDNLRKSRAKSPFVGRR